MISPDQRIGYLPFNRRPRIRWPNNARVAFWVIPNVEHYEYLPPAHAAKQASARHDNPDFPAPSLPVLVRRDYGNRVGFWRMLQSMDRFNIRCTVNINMAVLEHFPEVRDAMVSRNWDFCCHGMFNTRAAPRGLSVNEQRAFIQDSIEILKRTTGRQLKGLNVLSRATEELPDILAEHGLIYHADYFHDDQPTPIRVAEGRLVSVPYTYELNDAVLLRDHFELDELLERARAQLTVLRDEATRDGAGRVMCVSLHPCFAGQPHRAGVLDEILALLSGSEGTWCTTAGRIATTFLESGYGDGPDGV